MAKRGTLLISALITLGLAVWTSWDLYSFAAVVWGFPLIALGFGLLPFAYHRFRPTNPCSRSYDRRNPRLQRLSHPQTSNPFGSDLFEGFCAVGWATRLSRLWRLNLDCRSDSVRLCRAPVSSDEGTNYFLSA
jgi:hypothetical protein